MFLVFDKAIFPPEVFSLFLALCIAGDVPTLKKRLFLKKIDTYGITVLKRT